MDQSKVSNTEADNKGCNQRGQYIGKQENKEFQKEGLTVHDNKHMNSKL